MCEPALLARLQETQIDTAHKTAFGSGPCTFCSWRWQRQRWEDCVAGGQLQPVVALPPSVRCFASIQQLTNCIFPNEALIGPANSLHGRAILAPTNDCRVAVKRDIEFSKLNCKIAFVVCEPVDGGEPHDELLQAALKDLDTTLEFASGGAKIKKKNWILWGDRQTEKKQILTLETWNGCRDRDKDKNKNKNSAKRQR